MPLTSPDLVRSYASPAEKDADWQRLLQRAETLRELAGLAGTPRERLPAEAAARLQAATPIAGEAPAQRLSRWRSVFASEWLIWTRPSWRHPARAEPLLSATSTCAARFTSGSASRRSLRRHYGPGHTVTGGV
jgi:hypothetical protein